MRSLAIITAGFLILTTAAGLRAEDALTHDADGNKHPEVAAMQKDLDLNNEQVANLKKIMASERDAMKSNYERRQQAMKTLREQVENKAPDAEIQLTLDEIKSIKQAMMDQAQQFSNQKDDILSPTQRAKLMLNRKEGIMGMRREQMMKGKERGEKKRR